MKPCYNCKDRQLAAAGAAIAIAAKKALPGVISATGNAFAQQKELEWSAPECGKRPFFIGRRRNEWEQCQALAKQRQTQFIPAAGSTTESKSFIAKNKTPLLIGGAVIGGLILFNYLNK